MTARLSRPSWQTTRPGWLMRTTNTRRPCTATVAGCCTTRPTRPVPCNTLSPSLSPGWAASKTPASCARGFTRWPATNATSDCARRASLRRPMRPGQPADGSRDTGRAELRRLIRATVDELEPDEREVIELSLRHHLDDSDLAVVLGMSARRAHALASHARGQLEKALGMLLIARTGRTTCAALDELLAGWDGRLTSQMRGLVGRHIEECQACAGRRRGALRPEALSGLFPLATLPLGLREQVLGLCASLPRDALTDRRRATRRAKSLQPAWFPRAGRLVGRDKIRGNPGATTAAAAVVMWVVAAVIATVITFTSSHPAHALAARTSGGASAVASTPANIRGGTPASTRGGSPASPEHGNQPPGDRLAPAVTPVSPTEQAKPSPSPALSPAPSPPP